MEEMDQAREEIRKEVFKRIQNRAFKFEDDKITFSALREVDYKGEKVDMVIYYECDEGELTSGTYKTEIFCDGSMIGSTDIVLK